MKTAFVHTLGDSTLDNIFWVDKKEQSVEGKLQQLLGRNFKVKSHAYDGFTTESVLDGDTIGAVLPRMGQRKSRYLQEKGGPGPVHPLNKLRNAVQKEPDALHYVVISVGGNDFRVNLINPIRMFRDIPQVQKRYQQIVEQVRSLGRSIRPILMFQYRTDAKCDPYYIYTVTKLIGTVASVIHIASSAVIALGVVFSRPLAAAAGVGGLYFGRKIAPLSITKDMLLEKNGGVAMLGALMDRFYQPILAYAKKEKIPVLDLPHTFDPYKPLYESGIEPNEAGGALIAEGLHHIITHHDFSSQSMLYAKSGAQDMYTAAEFDLRKQG